MMCNKCSKMSGLLLLLFGVLFLLQDTGVWNFWNLSWYTIAFLFMGFATIGCASCAMCQSCCAEKCEAPTSAKKKK